MSVTYADETPKSLHERTCSSVFNTSTPALTFFTHGLGCDASAWSNNFNGENVRPSFYSDSDSIIEKMRTSSTPSMNLYRVSSYNKNLTVYKQYEKGISSDSPHISNFSDHTLIVVEIDEWKEMRFVYEDFEYLVDSVISDYMVSKSTATIPSINLIGHSMGGLINMQYAIEHPKNVASLVSLGTPYNGSWYDNPVVGAFVSTFNEQRCISGTCNHDYYFCNLQRRKNKWNEVYSQNQHIGFYALCGETSNLLWQEMVFTGELAKYQGGLAQFGGIAMDIGTAFMGWWLLPGDICVDSDSQKATGYSGAVTYTKKFFPANSNVNKRCTNNVPIPHNLETYDSDMHKCILGLIDYNNSNSGNNVEEKNNIKANIITKSNGKYLIRICNNTGFSTSIQYNSKMCFESDAKNWTNLEDIETTKVLPHGSSTIIEIEENGTATHITMSYGRNDLRKVFYANNLNETSLTMSSGGNVINNPAINSNGMEISLLSKRNDVWSILLKNKTGEKREFCYNKNMCFEDDAKNWKNIRDVFKTDPVDNNESVILKIKEFVFATDITISYRSGETRKIAYAHNLNTDHTISCYENNVTFYYYERNGMGIGLLGQSEGNWLVDLTNITDESHSYEFNERMCFEGDAKNWTGLNDKMSLTLNNNETNSLIRITQNGFADYITISYVSGNTRYVFYANNLSPSGTLTPHSNSIDTSNPPSQCIVEGTMITLADYSQIPVEELTGEEMLLVWNFETGSYDNSPIMFTDSDPLGHYPVIELVFSDDTSVGVVSEHGFFDSTLCEFVYLDETAGNYIGHNFIKQDGNGFKEVSLIDVTITTKVTRTYSPVTYYTLNYYVNGMLSMPGGISGMFNIFSVDKETMSYDRQAMENDIDTYGLLTYKELSQCISVSEELFNGVGGQYLNIAIGKGLITLERIQQLAERYGSFVPEEKNGELNQATYDYSYIREYITNVFLNRGLSLKQYVEHLLRSYTNIPWLHISSTDFNNSIWKVGYDETYYYAQLKIRCYGMIFIVNIAVVHSN